jgi:holo-[acyl-carrier protein] synthase
VIFGVGTDIVMVARIERMIERHGLRAAGRILAQQEMDHYRSASRPAAFLAKRFAAKEALAKALGLGLRTPATLRNIAVAHDELGRPIFECAPPLASWLAERDLTAHLSISDEIGTALAFVVVEQGAH